MTFPTIKHLNDLVPFVEANPQFRIQKQPNGFTVVCYMLQDEDTFRGENEAYAQECRGMCPRPAACSTRQCSRSAALGRGTADSPR